MFWKKKEEPALAFPSSSSGSSSFNPLDVQSPPAFGDANGMNGGMAGMQASASNPYATGFEPNPMSQYPNGPSAATSDPFSQAPTGFGQPAFSNANQMMQQMQQNLPTNPISTLPNRSAPADPNAIHPRDVELILSRLELIRSEIENVNHRLSHLEQNAAMKQSSGSGKNKAWY